MTGRRDRRIGGMGLALLLAGVGLSAARSLTSDEPASRRRRTDADADRYLSETEREIRKARREDGRGRQAVRPTAIPAAGWMDVLARVYAEVFADRLLSVGAGVAFYAILAIVPFITAFVSVYGLVLDTATVQQHLEALRGLLPADAVSLVGDQMQRLADKPRDSLGLGFLVGLAIALWSSNAGMKAIFEALNVAYEEEEKRSFVWLNVVSLTFTLGAILMLVILIAATLAVPILLSFVGLGSFAEALLNYGRWPVLFLLLVAGLSILYRFGPSRRPARWRWINGGSVIAALLFVAVSSLFSWYAASWATYDETYGSLGTVIAFMTWLWLSSVVVLLGAEINSETEHQTLRDSTVGPDRPIGEREAVVADTVGAARG